MRRTISKTLPVAALLLAAPALAGPGSGGRHDRGPGGPGQGMDFDRMEEVFDERGDRMADLLELDAGQRQAFDQIRQQGFDAARPKMERMRLVGRELHELLEGGSTDATAVGQRAIEMHRLRGEVRAEREKAEAELVKLLTPEQKFAFEALKEARADRGHGDRRGPRGPDRGFHGDRGDRDRPAPPND